jgi:hypothetical protein
MRHNSWVTHEGLDVRVQTPRLCAGQQSDKELFKLSKFKAVDSRVKAFMGTVKHATKIEAPIHDRPVPELES